MAIDLGKVNVSDLQENAYKVIGISINRSSNGGGIFDVNYSTIQQAKSNLINLILTKKGERVGQPDFGCDIWKVLFEPIIEGETDLKVEQSIMDAVSIWLPYIQINQIFLEYSDEQIDRNELNLEISFSLVSNPNIRDNIEITVNA